MLEHTAASASGSVPDIHSDRQDVSRLLTHISWLAVPLLLIFAVRAYHLEANQWGANTLLALALGFLANALLFLKLQWHGFYRTLFIVLVTGLFTFISYSGLEQGAGILWAFAFPPLIYYIGDLKVGAALSVLTVAGVMLLFSPLGESLGAYPYSDSFKLIYTLALLFAMCFSYGLDRDRRLNRDRLLKLAQEFEYAAKHDSLTGLYNRHEGTARLTDEFTRFQRYGREFSLLLLDIDHFKRINDGWGHAAGDCIIRHVADVLRQLSRTSDSVIRWGGEEFLVLLPETEASEARQLAERIRAQIAGDQVLFKGELIGVTASLGVASVRASDTLESLQRRVDDHLYVAKDLGRNRVEVDVSAAN